jgi:hypothetical protein
MRPLAALAVALAACNSTDTCDDKTDDVGDLCLPADVAPNLPVLLEAREQCGATCTGTPNCSAIFVDGRVALEVSQEVCSSSQSAFCILLGCQRRIMQCTLPPLAEGDYALTVPGGPPRLLRVRSGGAGSCRFPSLDGGVQQPRHSW